MPKESVPNQEEYPTEESAAEILQIEEAEIALETDFFKTRQRWFSELEEDAQKCVEEMIRLCEKGREKLPGAFLLLIGAKNPDGSFAPGADHTEKDFLKNANEFVNHAPHHFSLSELASSMETMQPLKEWLSHLEENLEEAIMNEGEEGNFREKQSELHENGEKEEVA